MDENKVDVGVDEENPMLVGMFVTVLFLFFFLLNGSNEEIPSC